MARWYADGIIDPNFVTNDGDIASPNEYMGTGRAGAGGTIWNYAADAYKTQGFTDDEDFYLEAVPSPVTCRKRLCQRKQRYQRGACYYL